MLLHSRKALHLIVSSNRPGPGRSSMTEMTGADVPSAKRRKYAGTVKSFMKAEESSMKPQRAQRMCREKREPDEFDISIRCSVISGLKRQELD